MACRRSLGPRLALLFAASSYAACGAEGAPSTDAQADAPTRDVASDRARDDDAVSPVDALDELDATTVRDTDAPAHDALDANDEHALDATTSHDAFDDDAPSGDATDDRASGADAATPTDAAATGPGEPFAVEGFGRATRGGWQPEHDVVWVTTLDDDGEGSLRDATRTGDRPRVVRFLVDGAIELRSPLVLPSNITIDARGRDVHLRRKGLVLPGVSEVVLTSFSIEHVAPDSEDGVQIGHPTLGPSRNIVLDHLRFLQEGRGGDSRNVDEAISVVFGARDITVQWCRFERWEKVMLLGNGDAPAAVDEQMTLTAHHNYALATGRRHPEARYGRFDFYDNYWDDWRMYGWLFEPPFRDSFAMHCRDRCRLLAENNAFRRTGSLMDVGSRAEHGTSCASGGVVEERGSFVAPGSTAPVRFGVDCPAGARAFERPYATPSLEPANAALVERLVRLTGPQREP